jgi:hypothetical protein
MEKQRQKDSADEYSLLWDEVMESTGSAREDGGSGIGYDESEISHSSPSQSLKRPA